MVARRRREAMVKLNINNKAAYCDAFAGQNLKRVYLAMHFSVLYFAVRWYFIQLKKTIKYFAQVS